MVEFKMVLDSGMLELESIISFLKRYYGKILSKLGGGGRFLVGEFYDVF